MRWTTTRTLLAGSAVVLGLALCAAAADDAESDAPLPEWKDVPAVKLWQAVKAGDAAASGSQPRSYQQVLLKVTNRSKRRQVFDVGGSHLRPNRRGSCQRLGLGPPVVVAAVKDRGPGTACLELEPGEARSLMMNTCCLDAGRSAPSNHRFTAVAKELPEVRESVLRWWVANPDAAQSAVNSAIWRNSENVIENPGSGATRRVQTMRQSAVYGGVHYQLKNGDLTSLDEDGVRRVLGSQIWQVFPTDGAVYAVMPGEDRQPDLWRLAPTGKNPWGFVTDVHSTQELLDVVPAGDGNLALLFAEHVAWFDHEAKSQTKVIDVDTDRFLSARVGDRGGRVFVTLHDPRGQGVTRSGAIDGQSAGRFEIWVIDPKRGKAEMTERFWNVSAIRAGRAGIYGLSHKGVIRRFAKGKFKDVGPVHAYQALVAIGVDKVWVIGDTGRLVATDATSGRRLFTSEAKVDKNMWLDLDPVTGDLAYVTSKGFFVIRGADGSVAKVPEVTEPDTDNADDDR